MPHLQRAALLLSLALLAACGKAPEPAAPAAPAADASAACLPLPAWTKLGKGALTITDGQTDEGYRVAFALTLAGRSVGDEVLLPADTASGITIDRDDFDAHTTVCAGQWFILNLPAERGGQLIVAQPLGAGLAMQARGYDSDDEHTATITWGEGAPRVDVGDGQPWLLPKEAPVGTLAQGTGAPVVFRCENPKEPRGPQFLTLGIDSAGRLARVDYLSAMPGGASCSVAARRGDDETAWSDGAAEAAIRWGEDTPEASRLHVTRDGERYTVDTRGLRTPEFCGQSSEMALTLGLQAGQATCTVAWPQEDAPAQASPEAAAPAASASAVAEPAPQPGFDCKAAKTPAERLICARAPLARLDAQATRLYGQARQHAQDAEVLKKEQLAWLRGRDTECIAGASWDEVREDERVAGCLALLYASRIRALRDAVAPPLLPSALLAVSDAARQTTGLARKGCEAMQGVFGEEGKVLAVEVNCEQAQQGRRVWLIERGDRAVAATPELGAGDPHGERIRTTGTDLYWDGDTLYTFTSMAQKGKGAGDDSDWRAAHFTATLRNGSTRIASVPKRIELFFGERIGAFFGDDEGRLMNGIDDAIGDGALSLGRRHTPTGKQDADGTQHFSVQDTRLVWIGNPGAETYTLYMKNFEQKGAVTEIARGGPELLRLVFDNWHVIYPAMDGLQVFDLQRETTQRIAGTTVDDLPLAWEPASGTLAWSSPQPCGGAKASAGGRFVCIAHLDGVRMP